MGIIHNLAIFTNSPAEGGTITEKGRFWIEQWHAFDYWNYYCADLCSVCKQIISPIP